MELKVEVKVKALKWLEEATEVRALKRDEVK